MMPQKPQEKTQQISFRDISSGNKRVVTSSINVPREGNIIRVFDLIDGINSDENWNHEKVAYARNHIEVENIISFVILAQ